MRVDFPTFGTLHIQSKYNLSSIYELKSISSYPDNQQMKICVLLVKKIKILLNQILK